MFYGISHPRFQKTCLSRTDKNWQELAGLAERISEARTKATEGKRGNDTCRAVGMTGKRRVGEGKKHREEENQEKKIRGTIN